MAYLVEDLNRFFVADLSLFRDVQDMLAAGRSAFAGDGHRVFAAGAGGVGQVVSGGKRPFAERVHDEGKVFRMIIAVVGGNVEGHLPKRLRHVNAVAGQCEGDLHQLNVIGGGDAKVGLD